MISKRQEEYLASVESLKDVKIEPGYYHIRNEIHLKVIVLGVDEEKNLCTIQKVKSGFVQTKTLHWCKKSLVKD